MAEEHPESSESDTPRDDKGRFTRKSETVSTGESSPSTNDYSKMNAILQKQTGLSAEKFIEYQRKMTPHELFDKLSFMADNMESVGQPTKKQTLPENQKVAPTSPGPTSLPDLPGTVIGKPNFDDQKFSLQVAMTPDELLGKNKNKNNN